MSLESMHTKGWETQLGGDKDRPRVPQGRQGDSQGRDLTRQTEEVM